MRRFLIPLLATAPLFSLPLNNPMQPYLFDTGAFTSPDYQPLFFQWVNVRLGFYGDYIFDTKMEVDKAQQPNVRGVSVMTNAGEIDVNWGSLDLFATLGASQIKVSATNADFIVAKSDNYQLDLKFESNFSWSLGGRWALLEYGSFTLGVEGQYFRTTPSLESAHLLIQGCPRLHADYRAWQVGAGVSRFYEINDYFSLVPYAGAFWLGSSLDLSHDNFIVNGQTLRGYDLEKKIQYGWAFGLTMALGGSSTLTGEARFGGEKAAFANLQVQF